MSLSRRELVVGSYVPLLKWVVDRRFFAFQAGVGARQLCAFMVVVWW
jgi:hypothetical protein